MKAPSTGETLLIRRYRTEDREIVLRLHEVGLRETGTFVEGWDLDEDLLDIEGTYLNDSGEFFVGLLADRIVAIGALRGIAPGRAEIKRMRVDPAFQRRGFGQAILDALEERATELGYATLHLDTTVQQQAARRLYTKNGYREVHRDQMGPFECVFYEKGNLA
jgi:ribosomal protein S18 acetylase RimI-like enzyme